MGAVDRLNATTLTWLKSIGVSVSEVVDKSWPDSDSQVSRITVDDGRSLVVKRFGSQVKFDQAHHAYQNWLVGFEEIVPRLVTGNSEDRILLLTDIGSPCCQWQELSSTRQESLLRQAGKFLRALHERPLVDDDQMALGNAVLMRAERLQRQLGEVEIDSDCLSPGVMNRIIDEVAEIVPLMNQIKRVPCHRDFWRRNWIWTEPTCDPPGGVRLGVIDFEHARPDLFVFDFMKLWSDCWLIDPRLEGPFWDGYGRRLSSEENSLLIRCAQVHAVQTMIWAAEHHDTTFFAHGERLLAATDAA